MLLHLDQSTPSRVISPHRQGNRLYHLLFRREYSGPFHVRDATYSLNTMITIGQIYKRVDANKILVVGNIFYTTSPILCGGSFLVAYSGVFREQVTKSGPKKDFKMDLVLREKLFHVFHEANCATMIVSPSLPKPIQENFEA
jgi:hypothetical protein